jgi:hypothetical protein
MPESRMVTNVSGKVDRLRGKIKVTLCYVHPEKGRHPDAALRRNDAAVACNGACSRLVGVT